MSTPLPPGATIGILGGGQLGRMLALAAARLGFKCHVMAPSPDAPAFDVVQRSTCADYTDTDALDRFAADVDVVTYEFENVPADTATFLSSRRPVLPDPQVLATTQDRLAEKTFIAGLGIPTAKFAAVGAPEEFAAKLAKVGRPAVLKASRFGYDGKGQVPIGADTDLDTAWRECGGQPAIVEALIKFEREISVVAARSAQGRIVCYEAIENEHRDRILKRSVVPANVSPAVAAEAKRIAETIAEAFGYIGVLAVEMFVVPDGKGHTVLVNEIAPRVHNSGHWTLDGCSVSQFEQHIRAIAGWPLAEPVRRGRIEMINLIGEEVADYVRWINEPSTAVHLYGKAGVRPGRKMGHVTRVF